MLRSKIFSVLIIAFIMALFTRLFILEGFVVLGDSMYPTIVNGDYVFVNKLAYVAEEPEREDLVVAKTRPGQRVIKRIIGLPGERVSIGGGKVYIKNDRLDPGLMLNEGYLSQNTLTEGTSTINLDPEEYFALGDNRAVSIDSREVGPIDKWHIKGKVIAVFNIKTLKFRILR